MKSHDLINGPFGILVVLTIARVFPPLLGYRLANLDLLVMQCNASPE